MDLLGYIPQPIRDLMAKRVTNRAANDVSTQATPPNKKDTKPTDSPSIPSTPPVNPDLSAIPACWSAVSILSTALANSRIGVVRLSDPEKDRYDWMPRHPLNALLKAPSNLFSPWPDLEDAVRTVC